MIAVVIIFDLNWTGSSIVDYAISEVEYYGTLNRCYENGFHVNTDKFSYFDIYYFAISIFFCIYRIIHEKISKENMTFNSTNPGKC